MDSSSVETSHISPNSDSQYFSSYEDIEIHRLMVNDEPRTTAYRDAILNNAHLFKDKIVMDVGAGTGILSLFAAKAGAKKVYAIEASNMAKYITSVAQENGFSNIIQVFHTKVEDFCLPTEEKVDVIISEWMGFYLLHESMIFSVIYARDNFLNDEGTIFPTNARLFACPCSIENYFDEHFYFWDNVHGFNMSSIKECAHRNKQTRPDVYTVSPKDLLAEPVCIKELNLLYITESDISDFSCTSFVGVTKPGNYQGLALWFDCEFDGKSYNTEGEEYGTMVTLSTSPFSPVTHWKQTVIVLGRLRKNTLSSNLNLCSSAKIPKLENQKNVQKSEKVDMGNGNNIAEFDVCDDEFLIEEDEVIGWRLDFSKSEADKRHYSIVLESLDPEECEHPIPCVCPTPRCVIIAKMIEKEENELLDQENAS